MTGKSKHTVFLMAVLLFFLNRAAVAQDLNRQMFSSQGTTVVLENGTFVSQSIGQQSMFGSFSNSAFTIQQGFQHSAKAKYNKAFSYDPISIVVYPNPIADVVNFKFLSEVTGIIKISILSAAGRQVYSGEKGVIGNILTVESLGNLPAGVYLVYLSSLKHKYAGKIIKK